MKTNIRCLLAAGVLLTLLPACTAAGGSTPAAQTPTAQTVAPAPQVKSVDDYLAVGDYKNAFTATDDEAVQNDIRCENMIVSVAKDVPDKMKDPTSFSLRGAWYDPVEKEIVLYISGKNSLGGLSSSYWYYSYSSEDKNYGLWTTYSDLYEDEKIYSWDDTDEELEKRLKNYYRSTVKK